MLVNEALDWVSQSFDSFQLKTVIILSTTMFVSGEVEWVGRERKNGNGLLKKFFVRIFSFLKNVSFLER